MVNVSRCVIRCNLATRSGGGVRNTGIFNLTDTTVADNCVAGTDNNAAFEAGIYSNATLALTRCTISGNSIRGRDGNYTTFPADALGGASIALIRRSM